MSYTLPKQSESQNSYLPSILKATEGAISIADLITYLQTLPPGAKMIGHVEEDKAYSYENMGFYPIIKQELELTLDEVAEGVYCIG